MRFDVITLFPKMFETPLAEGVVGHAIKEGRIGFQTWNPRNYSDDNHKTVDDRPFGGGDGMVMLPEILKKTLQDLPPSQTSKRRVIYLSPQGPVLSSQKAQSLCENYDQIIFVCGRYGGIDERFLKKYIDEELSVGDYILSGGELAAMVAMDVLARYVPGVLGNDISPIEDSFKDHLLEAPLYTKPREFEGEVVPEILLSGHHENIKEWKRKLQIQRTLSKRPDLLANAEITKEEMGMACENLTLRKNVAVGLVHYPVYNKTGEVVATNVTNLDIHDIARACRTYGVDQFYIITPSEEQLAFVGRVLEHWQSGRGIQYNPIRKDALVNTRVATSLESALEQWGQPKAKLVATSARLVVGPKPVRCTQLREIAMKESVFLVFGTGYGLENSMVRNMEYMLEPIRGRSPDGFRHLSVRSAASIILDRLFGACY